MVDIYLNIEDQQVLALSIPFSDIERLSVRPVKWLRFVAFAICGVRGQLSATPNSPAVDYNISLADPLAAAYYYTPERDYQTIHSNASSDRITSSEETLRSSDFRSRVMERDGPVCVFTGSNGKFCDVAHLLPKRKGNKPEYIAVVLEDRRNSYDPALDPGILEINSIENALLLRKDLHMSFGLGCCAFLATPNFALDPADIPRVGVDPMPPSRLTLHHLIPDTSHDPTLQWDAYITAPGTGIPPPCTIILDFMYGVAAYQHWGSGQGIKEAMQHRFDEQYRSIPIPPSPTSSDGDNSPEPDDLNDPDYIPYTQQRRRIHRLNTSDGMLSAMEDVLALSMLVKGTRPVSMAAERGGHILLTNALPSDLEVRTLAPSMIRKLGWPECKPYFYTKIHLQESDRDARDEAYSSSVKLQRHSLETANAHDRVVRLEHENDLLRSELAVLRAHPHPDASPQAHPAVLQVQQLTLSLRRLSDKLSLTEETLLERTTQLAHATGEATKAKLAAEGAYELAARTRGREEAGKLREMELEGKVRAAKEAVKMSDLVVNEYADLVRSLESRAGTRPTTDSRLSSSAVPVDGHATSGSAMLPDSLSEGKLGLQRLLAEFFTETENLQKDLLQVQGELAASEAKHDSEKNYTEHCRVELAQAQFELQQLKIDDNAAAKMVSRYMKFSQKSTDTLQDALTTLKTRHTATVDTLSAQLSHLSSRLHFAETQTEKLRDALDELGGEMVKEMYGRRREVALRIRMVNREEKLREELERWVLRGEEALGRQNADSEAVQDRMIRDARAVLMDSLGGTSGSSHGSLARLITAQHAVEALTAELELETRRRLELERVVTQNEPAAPQYHAMVNGNTVHPKASLGPPLAIDKPLPRTTESDTPPVMVTTQTLPSPMIVAENVTVSPEIPESLLEGKSAPMFDVRISEPSSTSDAAADDSTSSALNKDPLDGGAEYPMDLSINLPDPSAPQTSLQVSEDATRDDGEPSSNADRSAKPSETTADEIPEQPMELSSYISRREALISVSEDETTISPSSPAVLPGALQQGEPGLDPKIDAMSPSIPEDVKVSPPPDVKPALPGDEGEINPLEYNEEKVGEPVHSLTDQDPDELELLESGRRDTPLASPSPSSPPSLSPSPISSQSSSRPSHVATAAVHLDVPKPAAHPLLAELSKAKHRYNNLQRALRDCHLALETLSSSVSVTLDPRTTAGSVPPEVLRTALQRLNDYTEDARVELEIRMADEALVARGFETLLSVPGALSSPSISNDDHDSLSHSDVERQVDEFVSGTDSSVEKALRSLSRKLEDIQHDIAVLKRAVHDEVISPAPPLTAPATNGASWTSWIRSPTSPANPASGLGSPAPSFGNVMTTPRLRHSPSLNFQQGSLGKRIPGEPAKDPFTSLGLRVPMPSYVHHAGGAQHPQPRSRTLSTMYMLGLGARRPSGTLAPSPSPRKSGLLPSLGMGNGKAEMGYESEEEMAVGDEGDSDVE